MDTYDVEVEAQAQSLEEAKALAVEKLDLPEDRIEFVVVQEGKGGFLGVGSKPAVVKARPKPKQKRRRRRRSRDNEGGEVSTRGGATTKKRPQGENVRRSKTKTDPEKVEGKNKVDAAPEAASIEEQAEVAKTFISGLLTALGLEGTVTSAVEKDILLLKVDGDQTEALVGPRGTIMQSVLELTRTVIQRNTYGAPRMRIDIAGYGERRREALTIYARNLAEKVLADGGEVMLEAMNAADRKVVHDAVAEISGVNSLSEGAEPHRSVVISAD